MMTSSVEKSATESPPDEVGSMDQRQGNHSGNNGGDSKDSLPIPTFPTSLKRASTTPDLSAISSSTTSPKSSREASPTRMQPKSAAPAVSANSRMTRSRKNSTDFSPSRGPGTTGSHIPSIPSAAAIQRALSVAGTPQLQASVSQDIKGDAQKTQKPVARATATAQSGGNVPRVKSPPPPPLNASKTALAIPKKADSAPTTPSIVLERAIPAAKSSVDSDTESKENGPSGMRTPVRGSSGSGPALETVQESSLPATPVISTGRSQHRGKQGSEDRPERIEENPMEDAFEKHTTSAADSGNESSTSRATVKTTNESKNVSQSGPPSNSAKPQIQTKKSLTQILPSKAKAQEGSAKNMIVETETVSTIPQVALGGGAGERNLTGRTDTGGSLRLKPSNETIRPKKKEKKVVRKAPSLNSGTGGLQSRRFHHHHMYSRAPSPDNLSSISPLSDEFFNSRSSEQGLPRSATVPSSDRDYPSGHRLRSSFTDDGVFRPSSAVLTTFRGRTASSKADIFEQKVASAMDQTNSSDSEETFVYESNPPEPPLSARPHRFHSRTPSATSTVSLLDQHGMRTRQDGHHSIAGKKSMKFANNTYHSFNNLPGENDQGTVRGPSHSSRTGHHIGRYGRSGNGHTSLFDNDSPFLSTTKSRTPTGNTARISSRPTTPRSPHMRIPGTPKKADEPLLYDLEDDGADDERAPLVGSMRTGRNRRRPIPGSLRNGYTVEEKNHRVCRRVTAYTLLGALMASIIAAIVIVLVMCSKPLYEVRIKDIENVLASEQEIMFDLHVHAVNPSIVAIQISDLNIDIFAKSKYVGTDALWRSGDMDLARGLRSRSIDSSRQSDRHALKHRRRPHEYRITEGVDEGTDPIEDPETDSHTMLLGRIFEFDSPLTFDPSPMRHRSASSIGEVRLAKPGNKTEAGGTARWEKVILHDFELLVRGVVKYSLPISSHIQSAPIRGSVHVHPSDDSDSGDSSKSHHRYVRGSDVLLERSDQISSPTRARLPP